MKSEGMHVRFGAFAVDPARRQLLRDGESVHLTPKAFDLLALLIDEAPRVVPKAELHARLWPGSFVSDATLVGVVKELRHALGDRDPEAPIIRTVHRVGYAFSSPIERVSSRASRVMHWLVVQGRRIPLPPGEHIIGRDPACTVYLDAVGVSRRHARLVVGESEVRLEDLGSKNGTSLGAAPVSGQVVVHDGDSISIGAVPLVYRSSRAGMSTETQISGR